LAIFYFFSKILAGKIASKNYGEFSLNFSPKKFAMWLIFLAKSGKPPNLANRQCKLAKKASLVSSMEVRQ